jgi:hypothetical protein
VNEQARKPRNGKRCSELYGNIERNTEMIFPHIVLWSNKFDNNDPCMLRHTAGCSFKGRDEDKSFLIDLEAYDYELAA